MMNNQRSLKFDNFKNINAPKLNESDNSSMRNVNQIVKQKSPLLASKVSILTEQPQDEPTC